MKMSIVKKENKTDSVKEMNAKSSINSSPAIAQKTLPLSSDSKKATKSRSKQSRELDRNDTQKVKKLHPRKLF